MQDELPYALTFDDVLLVPAHSNVLPKDVSLKTYLTPQIELNIPLVSAAMDTVTEANMAISLAQEGGIGILHKNASIEVQAEEVKKVKKFESGVVSDPITVSPETTLGELKRMIAEYRISGMPVVSGKQVLGIITHRDWRFETDFNKPVAAMMTPKNKLITVKENASREEIVAKFSEFRLEKLIIVNDQFELKGIVTVKDLEKEKEKPLATKDKRGRLRVGAAIGVGPTDQARAVKLIEAGVDVIVVDTAHGHSAGVLEQIAGLRKQFPDIPLIGGNVATSEGALALVKAGVDAVKVGIGPGSICTTRMIAGVGMPQLSAIQRVAQALKKSSKPVPIIADGGIRYSGDIAKAIAAGAWCVMVGSILAGTDEAPGETILYQGRSYKTYRGMGSLGAMDARFGSSDRYFQSADAGREKLVPEGIEGRVPYKGAMLHVVHQLMGGLRSGMGYTGKDSIANMRLQCQMVRITAAGIRESHVHDVTITKEAPNYRSDVD